MQNVAYPEPDISKDQFFLTDQSVIEQIVGFAELNKNDVVLEVGAGTGNLTAELAKYAGKVIAFEIDSRFKPILSQLPKNVDMRYENAWEYIQLHGKFRKKKDYNKIVSNLPYSFVEQFIHNLTFHEYDKAILLVPIKFVNKIEKSGIFHSFFTVKILLEIPKEKFNPTPRTNSALIELVKLPYPEDVHQPGRYLRQFIYQHEDKVVKNSLMEGLIRYFKITAKKVITKNQARQYIATKNIPEHLLSSTPKTDEVYEVVGKEFEIPEEELFTKLTS